MKEEEYVIVLQSRLSRTMVFGCGSSVPQRNTNTGFAWYSADCDSKKKLCF
ncbi:MAG: hypothetical protein U0Y96_16585 [Candidatus Kapaibacterium sp.]